jgi:prepilin-type N-terminal cleavage/methylation domain-containing protein
MRSAKGMTLMEVMIAVAVIAVAVCGTMVAWVSASRMQALAVEESLAQSAITKVISDIRNTSFSQIPSPTDGNPAGYSGGPYPGNSSRYLPGKYCVYLGSGGAVKGEYWPKAGGPPTNPHAGALRGVQVSQYPFAGSVAYNGRYWAPGYGVPELRIIIVNNEDPVESETGEAVGDGDGVDLNGDGQISTTPLAATTTDLVGITSTPLFPRKLAADSVPASYRYLASSQMQLMPVVVQVRWWSVVGVPREIRVFTLLVEREGGATAP